MTRTERIRSQADWLAMAELCLDMFAAWPEFCRLAAIEPGPDGYGRGGGAGGRGSGVSNPTATVTVNIAGGKIIEEPGKQPKYTPDTWTVNSAAIDEQLANLIEQSGLMLEQARRIAVAKRQIEGRGDGRVGRQSSLQGDCSACCAPVSGVGEDRIKSSYGPCCYQAWVRYRKDELKAGRTPDHEVFRKRRTAKLKADAKAAERQREAS